MCELTGDITLRALHLSARDNHSIELGVKHILEGLALKGGLSHSLRITWHPTAVFCIAHELRRPALELRAWALGVTTTP